MKKRKKRINVHNAPPSKEPMLPSRESVRIEFGKRLEALMLENNINGSELARRAAKYTPNGKFGRDLISKYKRAETLPQPLQLSAICKVLKCKPSDLINLSLVPSAADRAPSFDVRDMGEGKVWLRINQAVSWDVAMKVMDIVKTADH